MRAIEEKYRAEVEDHLGPAQRQEAVVAITYNNCQGLQHGKVAGILKGRVPDYAHRSTLIAPAAQDDGQCTDCTNLLTNLQVGHLPLYGEPGPAV